MCSRQRFSLPHGRRRLAEQVDRGKDCLGRIAHLVAQHANRAGAGTAFSTQAPVPCMPQERGDCQCGSQGRQPLRGQLTHPVQDVLQRGGGRLLGP